MTIDTQTLNDVLIALVTTIGIAVALSIAMFAAGTFAERGKARAARAAVPPSPADHDSGTRELVLR